MANMERKNVTGWNIRAIRIEKGISIHTLSQSLGKRISLSPEELRDIELGVREIWDIELVAIARALEVQPEDLFRTPHQKVPKTRK